MGRDPLQIKPIPPSVSRKVGIVTAMVFFAFGIVAQYVLPNRFQFDATNMVDVAQDLIVGGDSSANVISNLIRVFTLPGLTFIVQLMAAGAILYLVSARRFALSIMIALFSIAIAAPLSLVRPQKETLVLLLTIGCVWGITRCKSEGRALFVCLGAYAIYTIVSLRPYYVLIVGAIVALSIFARLSPRGKAVALAALFAAGFFIPSGIFELLRMPRDTVSALRVLYPEIEGNRSAFLNPIGADSWLGFLGNYAYAIVRLNIPIVFSRTPSEFAMTLYALIWFYVLWVAAKSQDWRARLAMMLTSSHLLVLWIFEPDLGSYLRHYSSCILYLGPMLQAVDNRRHEANSLAAARAVARTPTAAETS